MTAEQIKKRDWLRRAKAINMYMEALEKQNQKDKRLAKYLSEVDESNEELNEKIKNFVSIQQKKIKELLNIREEIQDAIFQVCDDVLGTILTRHYLLYETIDTIAEEMHYDRRSIQRKHLKALDNIVLYETKGETE